MPCLAAVCQLLGRRVLRRAWPGTACPPAAQAIRAAAVGVALLLALAAPRSWAQGVDVLDLRARRDDAAVSVDYQLRVTLPPAVEDAALRGVPLYFTAQAVLLRPRWYWRDDRVARVSRQWRVSYQPLTSSWRVSQGGIGQSFASLSEALASITRSTGWHVADGRDVDPDGREYLEFAWRLDTSQLPRPMQIGLGGIGGTNDWVLGIERSLKLNADLPK